MKIYRKLLRYWFAAASLASFMGGWILLAHAPKPVQPVSVSPAALATLPPIQAYGSDVNNNGLNFFSSSAQSNPLPSRRSSRILVTGGS
jgi:hypothetical protein